MISEWVTPHTSNVLVKRREEELRVIWVNNLRGECSQFQGKRFEIEVKKVILLEAMMHTAREEEEEQRLALFY